MRAIPPGIQAKLSAGASTLARCWRVTRRDGAVYGFTEHDRPLFAVGTTFEAATGLSASAAANAVGFNVPNEEVVGGFSSEAVTEQDIAIGLWDGATVDVYLVDWENPAEAIQVFSGTVGELRRTETVYRGDIEGPQRAARHTKGRIYQRRCDAVLGDGRCKVDLEDAAYKGSGTVDAVVRTTLFSAAGLDGFSEGWFDYGHVAWLTGPNTGYESHIKAHSAPDGVVLEIWEPPPFQIENGHTFAAYAGCDKRGATCRTKFDNFVNFRGFETMPGDAASVRSAINDDKRDGSSRYVFD